MQLVPCAAPKSWLMPAPVTSLCRPAEGEQWDGFWSPERDRDGREVYFARCTTREGSVRWYRMDEFSAASADVSRSA